MGSYQNAARPDLQRLYNIHIKSAPAMCQLWNYIIFPKRSATHIHLWHIAARNMSVSTSGPYTQHHDTMAAREQSHGKHAQLLW